MIRSYYRCCSINEPVICIHSVLKLRHRFHALLKICSDRDDTAPLKEYKTYCFDVYVISYFCMVEY